MKVSKLLPLIGIALFIYILSSVNIQEVWKSVLKINALFGVAMGIFGATVLMRVFRWQVIIRTYGVSVPLRDATKAWLTGFSIGLITPGKVGDFARSYYLKEKMNIGKSLTTVIADRIIDVVVLFVLAIIGLTFFAGLYVNDVYLLTALYGFFAGFLMLLAFFSRKRFSSKILRPFFRIVPEKRKGGLKTVYDDFYSGLEIILKNKKVLLFLGAFTALIWAVIIFYLFVIAEMLGIGASYGYFLMIFPVITLVMILPISFSGLGTKDASIIFFFSFIGVSPEAAISFSLIHLLSDYVMGALGFALWYRNPIKLGE